MADYWIKDEWFDFSPYNPKSIPEVSDEELFQFLLNYCFRHVKNELLRFVEGKHEAAVILSNHSLRQRLLAVISNRHRGKLLEALVGMEQHISEGFYDDYDECDEHNRESMREAYE